MKRAPWMLAALALLPALAAAGTKKADPAEPTTEAEQVAHEYLKKIRLIEIQNLRGGSPSDFQKGREKLLAIEDERAVGPMTMVLYGANDRYKGLLIEALGSHAKGGSHVAKAYLQEIAVGDGNRGNRKRSVAMLKAATDSTDPKPTERLMAHLALDEVPVLWERSATALAELQEKRAVWLLVERLVTEEVRLVGAQVNNYAGQFDIRAQMCDTPTFRQRTISAAVPGMGIATVTIDLPQVDIVDVATTVSVPETHVLPEYKRVEIQHPAVLAALKQLTGQDFGYNQAAWQKWLQSAPKGIPPWKPIRFGSAAADGNER